jgi:hypothetical protein
MVLPRRWLFYIEGTLTILVAILAIFVLPDFPDNSHGFLSPEEVRLAQLRMLEDVGVSDDERKGSRFPGFFEALGDWRVYWLALALTSLVVALSFNAFFPTLTATLGYSPTVTLLLCAPPWIFATIVAFAVNRWVVVAHSLEAGIDHLCISVIPTGRRNAFIT